MKMKMSPKTYRFIAKHWPLMCGLIIGGMLGGIMQSISAFLLFGGIGWAYFHFDMFYALRGTPCPPETDNGSGFYLSDTHAMAHGAMFKLGGDDEDGAGGFYM